MTQDSSPSISRFLRQMSRPFWGYLAAQTFINIIWAIDLSLRPYLIKNILNQAAALITSAKAWDLLVQLSALFVVLSIAMTLTFRLYQWLLLTYRPNLKKHITMLMIERMLGHGHNLYQNQFSGNLAKKINDVADGSASLIHIMIDQFFSSMLALAIAIYAVWCVDTSFALVMGLWGFCIVLLSLIVAPKIKRAANQAAQERSKVMGFIVDVLTNVMSVRLFAMKNYEKTYLQSSLQTFVVAEQKRDVLFNWINFFQSMSLNIFQGICLYFLIVGLKEGKISVGDFTMIVMLNISISDNLWHLSHYFIQFSENLGDVSQGLAIISMPYEIEDKQEAKELKAIKGQITFDAVSFCYDNSASLFENMSVTIPAGQKVGLVGYSGGGKSTFVNLILRLFDVQSGSIKIDGQNISDATQHSLRRSIAMIPQEPTLFHRDIMENIRYGDIDASDDRVIEAAKQANAHEFIMALPQGYHTLVGERGTKLSGGQRQRVVIARAILKNAQILILDEATSQLDSITEHNIQVSLQKLMQNKTALVIAHRLSTLLQMDRILVFDKGKIVEDGSHAQLLMQRGLYKTLWQSQSGGLLPHENS